MTRARVQAVLAQLTGDKWLIVSTLYGSGLRLMECLRLRVRDLDFSRREITVHDGKATMTARPCSRSRSVFLYKTNCGW